MHIHFHARGRAKVLGHDGLVEVIHRQQYNTHDTKEKFQGVPGEY